MLVTIHLEKLRSDIIRLLSLILLTGHWLFAIVWLCSCSTPALSAVEPPNTSNSTKIAWLLSFPNSGTTYTLQSVMGRSNRTAASNTCLKWVHDDAMPTVYPDSGPYQLSSHDLPETYLLTRTHCAGHYPFRLKVDEDEFRRACRQTAVVERLGYK